MPRSESYEVSGLVAASTEYYFKLTAFNSVGEGSSTDEFNAFTPTDGLAFTPINSDTEYSVAKGTVSDTATAIAIPAYYEGKVVTTLGANAFSGFSQLVSIQLPDGLTDIGSSAFRDCSSLALTSLPDGITAIGMYAFENCSSLALTSLPNGLTSIKTSTFYYCSSLALTSLPDGITIIEEEAFEGCSKLALTSLPDKTYNHLSVCIQCLQQPGPYQPAIWTYKHFSVCIQSLHWANGNHHQQIDTPHCTY